MLFHILNNKDNIFEVWFIKSCDILKWFYPLEYTKILSYENIYLVSARLTNTVTEF